MGALEPRATLERLPFDGIVRGLDEMRLASDIYSGRLCEVYAKTEPNSHGSDANLLDDLLEDGYHSE